ncbi:hypothetical protein [Sulfurirhabdus autotrophica]|uniref:Uncharacterized protein n=1 Tax=Sulfurirhabdus autotrophica TaxID=1706046 RepID=A0A4R3Y2W9_9PROT|nr:hypothetical protein [Sulfurirhabdus autotrophica]TCV85822.1 hypothetical protein EDC63_10830 [Sulfurirhabdus autotrophica]
MNWIKKPEKAMTFFGLIYLAVVCYLLYWAFDFIDHPRLTIPDPQQDSQFGWLLTYFAAAFLMAYIAEIGVIKVKSRTVLVTAFYAIGSFFFVVDIISGNIGKILFFAWILFASIWARRYFIPFHVRDELKRQNALQEEMLEQMREYRNIDNWERRERPR